MRQWLNSNEINWFKNQHEYDSIPSKENLLNKEFSYDKSPGFLYGFNEVVKRHLTLVENKTAIYPAGSGVEYTNDLVFILSLSEMGLETVNKQNEGDDLKLFNSNADRIGLTYDNKPVQYWTRSPNLSSTNCNIRIINESGNHFRQDAYSSAYLRPIIVLH